MHVSLTFYPALHQTAQLQARICPVAERSNAKIHQSTIAMSNHLVLQCSSDCPHMTGRISAQATQCWPYVLYQAIEGLHICNGQMIHLLSQEYTLLVLKAERNNCRTSKQLLVTDDAPINFVNPTRCLQCRPGEQCYGRAVMIPTASVRPSPGRRGAG